MRLMLAQLKHLHDPHTHHLSITFRTNILPKLPRLPIRLTLRRLHHIHNVLLSMLSGPLAPRVHQNRTGTTHLATHHRDPWLATNIISHNIHHRVQRNRMLLRSDPETISPVYLPAHALSSITKVQF